MRKINEIIIHCTATPVGRNVSVPEIRQWHKKRGFKDIGYHFIIGLDGTIYQGRPIEQIGAHCSGHNRNSIGIAYVGGCTSELVPKDTRTPEQFGSMHLLVKSLCEKYPITSIVGHNKYANKACPCFQADIAFKHLIPINHDKEN